MAAEYRRVCGMEDAVQAGREFAAGYMFGGGRGKGSRLGQEGLSRKQSGGVRRREDGEGGEGARNNARQTQLEANAMLDYRVDIDAVKKIGEKVLLLGGEKSKEQPVSLPGRCLAGEIGDGKMVWDVPGGHVSFASRRLAREFCGRLVEVVERERVRERVRGKL